MTEGTIVAPREPLLSSQFTALLMANVGFGYAFSSFLLLPKFMASVLGAGPEPVGWVTLAHGATIVGVLPLLGAAVDRHGRCRFLTVGALVMAAASAGYASVDSVGPLLFALRMLQALGFSMVFAAGGALAVDLAPPGRLGQAIGLYGLSFLTMNAIATVAAEGIAERAGWTAAFTAAATGALLCAALSLRIREPERVADGHGDGATLFDIARRPATLRCLLIVAVVGSAMIAVFTFYQLYAAQLGIRRVSGFFIGYAATAVLMRGAFGHWMDRIGNHRAALVALGLYGPAVLATTWLDTLGLTTIGVGLGLAHSVFYPAFNAVAVGTVRPRERGRLMAIFQAAFQLGTSAGGLWGLLAAQSGYPAVFRASAAGVALAFLVFLLSPESRGPSRVSDVGTAAATPEGGAKEVPRD